MPQLQLVEANGVRIRAAVEGRGPLVIFVHGFPESWYSWRHQIGPVADAGFTACAIDVRGYGGSDKPHPVAAYDIEQITKDVRGVADVLSPDAPVVLVGHDWGAPIVWNTALIHPDKIRAVCGMSVPYTGVPAQPLSKVWEAAYTAQGKFFYQVYFQDEGVAEAELEADIAASLRRMYLGWSGEAKPENWPAGKKHGESLFHGVPDPGSVPSYLTAEEFAYFVGEFERAGFRGGLNRYRNAERDFAYLSQFTDRTLAQPALFVGGVRDPVLRMFPGADLVAIMSSRLANLRGVHLFEGAGHWVQQERPSETNAVLIDWLKAL